MVILLGSRRKQAAAARARAAGTTTSGITSGHTDERHKCEDKLLKSSALEGVAVSARSEPEPKRREQNIAGPTALKGFLQKNGVRRKKLLSRPAESSKPACVSIKKLSALPPARRRFPSVARKGDALAVSTPAGAVSQQIDGCSQLVKLLARVFNFFILSAQPRPARRANNTGGCVQVFTGLVGKGKDSITCTDREQLLPPLTLVWRLTAITSTQDDNPPLLKLTETIAKRPSGATPICDLRQCPERPPATYAR
ncbi:hypothetical protein EVAR_33452_1 [Eumeta japonica]|uniref:Uncharacterized protein n=1 Tax=Eumeta variegata TaxID=151549 RepID=A0A4C1WEB9_EUMVA|nr:hypothetical protein EVAR_33452_1 [Eumeta japonica]